MLPTLAALGFAAYNAATPSKTQWYETLSALLVACLTLQLPRAWGNVLVMVPLVSALLGLGWQRMAPAYF